MAIPQPLAGQPMGQPPPPWWRRGDFRPLWWLLAIAAVALVALLALTTRVFAVPTTLGGWLWWAFPILLIAIVWALVRAIVGSRVARWVALALAVLLLLPLGVNVARVVTGALSYAARQQAAAAPATTGPAASATATPSASASATPSESASTMPASSAPATPAPAALPIVVSAPADGATVGQIFTVVGTGTVPQGQHLVVFVWATGAQRYFFDGEVQPVGTGGWIAPEVHAGSCSVLDNGHTYTVSLWLVGTSQLANLSSAHSANPDAPVALAGSLVKKMLVTRDRMASSGC